jgi:uncharacterized protein involved in exopolysaccharide biosynthesis
MGKNKNKFDFDSGNILLFIIKKSKILFAVAIAAIIVSTIVSLLMTPMFKSTVIVFPTSTAAVSKSILNTQYSPSKGDLLNFGLENECDQYLQVLNSNEIKDLINKKFDLMEHYGLDSTKTKYPVTKYYDYFKNNFSFRRSEYLSIIIDVYDRDPKLAAQLANGVAAFSDTLIKRMQKERASLALNIAEREYKALDSVINFQEDSAQKLRLLGASNYGDQSIILTKLYFKALLKGKTDIANSIKKRLENVTKYAKNLGILENAIADERIQRSSLNYKYTEAKAEFEQNLPNKFIVESAKVSEKKASPKRALIVLTSTISAIFFALVLILIIESLKKII